MTVKEILKLPEYTGDISPQQFIREYLENNNYDGLFNPEGDCACENDDLFPCGEYEPICDEADDCEPGYKIACDCGDDHNFHISRTGESCGCEER